MRVGEFEKVSEKQFFEAMADCGYTAEQAKAAYDSISLPVRATEGSAGYDIKAPFDFSLMPGESIKVPTGLRVRIYGNWFLMCVPRSGLGFKYRMQLANTCGIVDADYAFSDNEGHIFLKVTNDNREGKTLDIKTGDGFAQAIFLPYGITYSDDASGIRNGGFGSTGA